MLSDIQTAEEATALLESNPEIAGRIFACLLYVLIDFVIAIVGLVLLIRHRKMWIFSDASSQEHAGHIDRKMLFNSGTAFFAIICATITIARLFGS